MADGGVVHRPSTGGWGPKAREREKREEREGEKVSVPSSLDLQPLPFLGRNRSRVGRDPTEKPWPAGWGLSCLTGDVIP